MVHLSYTSGFLYLSAILSLGSFIKPSYAFNIAPSSANSLFVGSSFALQYTLLPSSSMNMDVKLAVQNADNVLDVIAVIATNDHVANNYAGIYTIPSNIPEGSNYFFISQISGESGDSSYAETGPHSIPKSFSPFGVNLPSVAAATVLETFPMNTAGQIAVAQTTSSTANSVTPNSTPTPTPSGSQSTNTKSSPTSTTPTSNEKPSNSNSNTTTEKDKIDDIMTLSKNAIIAIAVVVPVVGISIILIAFYCFTKHRRRNVTSNGTTPWGTRTTNFVTRDKNTTARY